MLNWQMSQSKIRTGDVITGKIFELRGFLGWIEEQPGETPLKYIKVLAKEQVLNLDEIENQYFTQNQMLLNEKNSIIEQLQQENHQLTEKMAEGLQDVISSLQEKLNHALGEVIRVTDTSRFFKVNSK